MKTFRAVLSLVFLAIVVVPFVVASDLAPSVPAVVEKPLADDMLQATVHRLANGLTVYLSPNHQEPRVSAWIAVRAGNKHDPADSTGMAHYQEHMLFKGTGKLGTLDYAAEKAHLDKIRELYEKLFVTKDAKKREEIYSQIDAQNIKASKYAIPNEFDKTYNQLGFNGINAFTGTEYTMYVCSFPSNRAESWARVESDRFADPVFRLFQTEIETVYEEKNMSLDNAQRIIWEAANRQLYKHHPYGQYSVLGSLEHLKNPSLKQMYDFFETYYVPNNMAIVMAGDFQREAMLKLIEKYFGSWVAKPLPEPSVWDLPPPRKVERLEVKYEAEEMVVIAWPLVESSHLDVEALTVMDMLMANSNTGIIDITLNQAQKVKSAGCYPNFSNDAGAFYMYGVPKKDQTLERVEKLLLGTVKKLKAGEFTDDDIKSIITNFEIGEKQGLESDGARVSMMARSFAAFEEWERTVGQLDRLRKVTKKDVLHVAHNYLRGDYVVVYRRDGKPEIPKISKPDFTKVDIDPARQSAYSAEVLAQRAKPLKPYFLKQGRDYEITDAKWGRAYTGPNPVNDLFSLSIGFKFGTRHDKALWAALELLGLAGAGEMSAEDFSRELYRLGTSTFTGSDERWWFVNVSGLDKNLEKSLELALRRFREPNIEKDKLAKMVEVAIGAHVDNKKNPDYVKSALDEYAQRGERSSVLHELNDEELKALRTGELVELLAKLWEYERNIHYIGNREPQEIIKLLDDGRTEYKKAREIQPVSYLKPEATRILFAHRDMVQSQVSISAADEVLDAEKAVDYIFFSSYLGGGMSGLVFQEMREARALAYAAWGGYGWGHWAGDENQLYGVVYTQADKTIEATELLGQLLREPPLGDERFAETAKSVEERYRTNRIKFREVPFSVLRWEEQGIMGGDPRAKRFKRVLRYKLEDLGAFSARFKGRPLTIAILGHRDNVDIEGLKKLGDFREVGLDEIFPY